MPFTAQELHLDYFKFYDVGNQPGGQVVKLQGQFDPQPEQNQLQYSNFFANPASKNSQPMVDKNAHLTWYQLYDPVPDPMRQVVYEDQFGKREIITGRGLGLLVPTQKKFPGTQFPEKLDHYKVYQVLHAEPVNQEVKLEDQFGSTEDRVYYPRFFAVPVKKWHQGQSFGIYNEKTHLAIYIIYPRPMEKTAVVRDQFGQRYLHVSRSILLGAPCLKHDWKVLD